MAVQIVRPATAFQDTSRRRKQPRVKEESHLAFIRSLPCCVCGKHGPSEAAHIRMADARYAKRASGTAEKPSDRFTVPLCPRCHRLGPDAQHSMNERVFWEIQKIDVIVVAAALHAFSGDEEAAALILRTRGLRDMEA